jgi:hypothetical protein
MPKIVTVGVLIVMLSVCTFAADNAAPVPSQIVTAKRVFISNGGQEMGQQDDFSGQQDRCYNQFYSAMKSWGHYELATGPADADLVMEIKFANPAVVHVAKGDSVFPFNDPRFTLTIFDSKTHFILWSFTEHASPAQLRRNRDKNYDLALANIVDDVKQLESPPTAGDSAKK